MDLALAFCRTAQSVVTILTNERALKLSAEKCYECTLMAGHENKKFHREKLHKIQEDGSWPTAMYNFP